MFIHPRLLDPTQYIVAGHRGARALYPENTILSFEKAIGMGVDMLEMDVNVSRDGVPIVMHDTTLDRTTNGEGPIRNQTLAELKALDAGVKFSADYAGLRIPTMEEFCALMAQHKDVLLNVEIKDKTHECVDKTIALLAQYGLVENCVFACFDADIVKYFHDAHDLPTQGFPGFLMQHFEPGLTGTLRCMTAVGIDMKLLTPERVIDYQEMGILPWGYCPDDEQGAAYARYSGVKLVTCNNPEPSLRIFKA